MLMSPKMAGSYLVKDEKRAEKVRELFDAIAPDGRLPAGSGSRVAEHEGGAICVNFRRFTYISWMGI